MGRCRPHVDAASWGQCAADTLQGAPHHRQSGCLPGPPQSLGSAVYGSGADSRGGNDFTYLRIHEGWLCLAIVVDLFSRKVVG